MIRHNRSKRYRTPPSSAASAIGCAAVTVVVLVFAIWGGIGYVAYHFISKAW